MSKPELNKDLLELLKEFYRINDPKVLTVSGRLLNKIGIEESYDICSSCYAFIAQTWDHADWCELYEAEKLSDWIKKGKNEK